MDQSTKAKVIDGLRTRAGDQIRGHFYNTANDRYGCAVGIMAETLGYDRKEFFSRGSADGPAKFLMTKGFRLFQLQYIVTLNDEMHFSFDDIADYIDKAVEATNHIAIDPSWIREVEHYANTVTYRALINA